MKILYLIRENIEEIVSPAYYEIIMELKNQGHQITVANLSGKFPGFKCIKLKQFKCLDYPFGFINRLLFGRAANRINFTEFDVILSTMAEALYFLDTSTPKVAVIHDNFAERAKFTPWIGGIIFKFGFIPIPTQLKIAVLIDAFVQKLSMRKANAIVFLNEEEKKTISGKLKAKILSIHNGVFLNKFKLKEIEMQRIKERYPDKIILFLARLELQKNPFLFLKAAQLTKKDCIFLMAGKGPLQNKITEFIKKNSIKKVKFLGWLNEKEKIALLNACFVYVLPSLFEPVSVSTLEAMACKKPVIVSNVGGLKEIVDSSTGIKINPSSEKELAEAIDFLLDNPKKAREMGLNGFNKIKKEFLWKNIVKKYVNLFEELLNEK
jgi:glycosyltransferase involved in cell wall biosynthesis